MPHRGGPHQIDAAKSACWLDRGHLSIACGDPGRRLERHGPGQASLREYRLLNTAGGSARPGFSWRPEPASTALRLTHMSSRRLVAALMVPGIIAMLLMVGGCAATGCKPPAGGECAGPQPLPPDQMETDQQGVLFSGVGVSPEGRTIIVVVDCGGRLVTRESKNEVLLTWIAPAVGAGAMSCPLVPLTAHLRRALGGRPVIDGVTRTRVHPLVCVPEPRLGNTNSRSHWYLCTYPPAESQAIRGLVHGQRA
jgi:hypothetical protein